MKYLLNFILQYISLRVGIDALFLSEKFSKPLKESIETLRL